MFVFTKRAVRSRIAVEAIGVSKHVEKCKLGSLCMVGCASCQLHNSRGCHSDHNPHHEKMEEPRKALDRGGEASELRSHGWWSQNLMHTAPISLRLASLLEALATEISSVFSELPNLGFPKVGGKDPSAKDDNHFLSPYSSKSSLNTHGQITVLIVTPSRIEAQVASTRGEPEGAEPEVTFRTSGLGNQLYHRLSMGLSANRDASLDSAFLFAKWEDYCHSFSASWKNR